MKHESLRDAWCSLAEKAFERCKTGNRLSFASFVTNEVTTPYTKLDGEHNGRTGRKKSASSKVSNDVFQTRGSHIIMVNYIPILTVCRQISEF